MPVEAPLLAVRRLTQRFRVGGALRPQWLYAVSDVSFEIGRGEVLAIVGESGSGKSTIAKSIARFHPVTAGEIVFEGRDVLATERRPSPAYRKHIQMIFQDPFGSLNPIHSVGHHLARPLTIHHPDQSRSQRQDRIVELLERVGLTPGADVARKLPHELSGGQRQRVAIARALAPEPTLILADEPISMLDVSIRMGVLNLMDRLRVEDGLSFLYITHDIASARYLAQRIVAMYAGTMVEGAPSEELIANPAHPYTRLLLSSVPRPGSMLGDGPAGLSPPTPSLFAPPTRCPFVERCPHAMPVCSQEVPPAFTIAPGHWASCHLYRDRPVMPIVPMTDIPTRRTSAP